MHGRGWLTAYGVSTLDNNNSIVEYLNKFSCQNAQTIVGLVALHLLTAYGISTLDKNNSIVEYLNKFSCQNAQP